MVQVLGKIVPIESLANIFDVVEKVVCIYQNNKAENSWVFEFPNQFSSLKIIYYFNHLEFVGTKLRMGFFFEQNKLPNKTSNSLETNNNIEVDEKKIVQPKLPSRIPQNSKFEYNPYKRPDIMFRDNRKR